MTLHDNIGKAVAKVSSHLICDNCKRKQSLSGSEAGKYLQNGWPKCCGHTMRLVGKNEPK